MIEKITTPEQAVRVFNAKGFHGSAEWQIELYPDPYAEAPCVPFSFPLREMLILANALSGYYDAIESERNALQTEVDRMKPVVEAAKHVVPFGFTPRYYSEFVNATDALIQAEKADKKSGD